MIFRKSLLLWLLFIPELALCASVDYYLTANKHTPEKILAEADTSKLGTFILQAPRHLPHSSAHAPVVSCMNDATTKIVQYGNLVQCKKITWGISVKPIDSLNTDVSIQENLYAKNNTWRVIFEWNAIPRIKGIEQITICTKEQLAKKKAVCQALPTTDGPPLIMAWGESNVQKKLNGVNFSIYFDRDKSFLNKENWQQLSNQFTYLSHLFQNNQKVLHLDLILVGIDKKLGRIGGAAGKRAFIANYITDNDKIVPEALDRLKWVSGHELFHLLSLYEYPTWISESLAQYYGYKSLIKAGGKTQSPISMWEQQQSKLPHSEVNLYQAYREYTEKDDMSYYPLFYIKGAAFWQKLDEMLSEHQESLDDYLALIGGDEKNGSLNTIFIDKIVGIIGKNNYQQLANRYLYENVK